MARITLVKKRLEDGRDCGKCAQVLERLRLGGHLGRIHRIVVAAADDPAGEGMILAARHGVRQAPFFLVEEADGSERVYTVYLQLLREVLQPAADRAPAHA